MIKAYKIRGGTDPVILNIGTRLSDYPHVPAAFTLLESKLLLTE